MIYTLKELLSEGWLERLSAIRNPNATEKDIHAALDDFDSSVRVAAASHPNATKANLDKALKLDYRVRAAVAKNPNATREQHAKAISDMVDSAKADHPYKGK